MRQRTSDSQAEHRSARSTFLVAAGIGLSRLAGLVRERVFAHYFGNSDAADAFKAALRIPNFLQNLFGEGVLSASFIPVYARLLAREDDAAASRLAATIGSLLALLSSTLVLGGILATPFFIDLVAPGFVGEKRLATITLVKILFPGVGLLVLSAWCLGILNTHRRFFLSYVSPVLWNAAIIAALIVGGWGSAKPQHIAGYPLATIAAYGAVIGSALQLGVQLPTALRLLGRSGATFRPNLDTASQPSREVFRTFLPVLTSRGVVQISAYVDGIIASLLPTGAVSALSYAQTLYTLPVSLFGMSAAASELPEMARARGTPEEVALALRSRINSGLSRVAFFVVPSAAAFIAFGDVIAAAIYQSGAFRRADAVYVWAVLAGSTVGLLASTMGRLYASGFYALLDGRTPLRFAIIRVVLTVSLGWLLGIIAPRVLGIDLHWGTTGLTISAGVAGWVEFLLLRSAFNERIGQTGLGAALQLKLWGSASAAVLVGTVFRFISSVTHPWLIAFIVLVPFGTVYLGLALAFRVPEATTVVKRLRKL